MIFFENGQFVCRHPVLSNFMEKKQVFRQAVLFPELYASLIEVLVSSYFSFMLFQKNPVRSLLKKELYRQDFFVIFNSFYFTFRTSIHCNGVPVSEFWLWEWLVMWDVIDTSLVVDLWMFFVPNPAKLGCWFFFTYRYHDFFSCLTHNRAKMVRDEWILK